MLLVRSGFKKAWQMMPRSDASVGDAINTLATSDSHIRILNLLLLVIQIGPRDTPNMK